MLNLSPIFDDAIATLVEHGHFLTTPPLPATVFLMQCDVVNHYRYAVTHYFDLTLKEPYLQDSSLGPPYTKWAKFANDDFELLSFTIHNLLRYTGRFLHEMQSRAIIESEDVHNVKLSANEYISPLCDISYRNQSIGIRIQPDHSLVLTPFSKHPESADEFCSIDSKKGGAKWYRTTVDSHGKEQAEAISQQQFVESLQALRGKVIDIRDRSILKELQASAFEEIEALARRLEKFAELCRRLRLVENPFVVPESLFSAWMM